MKAEIEKSAAVGTTQSGLKNELAAFSKANAVFAFAACGKMLKTASATTRPPKHKQTRLEKGKVDSRVSTINAIEKTLAKAGVEFLPSGEKGEGVRMRSPKA